jgi:hypothetical protein
VIGDDLLKSLTLIFSLIGTAALADAPIIRNVTHSKADDLWRFDVTLAHGDTGWDDYADGWRISTLDGTILGTRKLAHPHVEEQPFTRSLSGVRIPEGVSEVQIQASDSVGGWTSEIVIVKIR